MNIQDYLHRIRFHDHIAPNDELLAALHRHHVCNIPFENLDVHYRKRFDIELTNVYNKVVHNNRGGFCYELNLLFNWLLTEIGFSSRIIAARVFDDQGVLGPELDHMSIVVTTDKEYLLDAGFGDLFVTPIEIKPGVQSDGRNHFRIDKEQDNYILSMSRDNTSFEKKYMFSLKPVVKESFHDSCRDKQVNPSSYFVRNIVCTKFTDTGRLTIFNDKLIRRVGDQKTETPIQGDEDLRQILATHFGVVVS